ncbi:uncharacterized protein MONBRDRAFT_28582 [Monosiga brevicollis MX1]|uniref:Folylpolyglutamate synthase n=1 Tax=Monosiga brevicollis TaxID=81824 RepID=A9V8L2_MONBE|nr:uncharacterized protein MONBRDRAFT_28582 [Monosiga brevicollis MX1]EDQ86103.1 predicted protein [Monosiga brevicollis MX1]|eukprot:XP_001749028.1 hypothetical protein [Monosiga brevicollis MX1]
MSRSYQEAVEALNTFHNAAELEKQRKSGGRDLTRSLPETRDYMRRLNITNEDLARMRIIHVAGSKGKGSTAAMCDALLRQQGFSTGLFTSPHLIEVRERIRVNGAPLSRAEFASTFWELYDALDATPPADDILNFPTYFRATFLMALLAFKRLKLDAIILEVGIGGLYDATNVVLEPWVCGITRLGLEHTSILGNTLTEIAHQKAGIMKENVPCFSQPQEPTAWRALEEAATQHRPKFLLQTDPLPPVAMHGHIPPLNLGIAGAHQFFNAGLAVQLVRYWTRRYRGTAPDRSGRTQVLRRGRTVYYIDGAHTVDSCQAAASWVRSKLPHPSSTQGGPCRVSMIFNCTGDRLPADLLQPINHTISLASQRRHPEICRTAFLGLEYLKLSRKLQARDTTQVELESQVFVVDSIECAIAQLEHAAIPAKQDEGLDSRDELLDGPEQHVIVTGSLHLVGGFLAQIGMEVQ